MHRWRNALWLFLTLILTALTVSGCVVRARPVHRAHAAVYIGPGHGHHHHGRGHGHGHHDR